MPPLAHHVSVVHYERSDDGIGAHVAPTPLRQPERAAHESRFVMVFRLDPPNEKAPWPITGRASWGHDETHCAPLLLPSRLSRSAPESHRIDGRVQLVDIEPADRGRRTHPFAGFTAGGDLTPRPEGAARCQDRAGPTGCQNAARSGARRPAVDGKRRRKAPGAPSASSGGL